MKLSKRTKEILNNFVSINDSIIFQEGNTISTKSIEGNVIARAEVEEYFPQEFAIYNLAEFLNVIALFDEPEITFEENLCKISEGGKLVIYASGNKDVIRNNPPKEFKPPEWDLEFNLLNKDYKQIKKASAILSQDMVRFVSQDGQLVAKTFSNDISTNATANSFDIVIKDSVDGNPNAVFPEKNMRLMDADYAVSISFKGISQFKSGDLTYWIALHASSSNEE